MYLFPTPQFLPYSQCRFPCWNRQMKPNNVTQFTGTTEPINGGGSMTNFTGSMGRQLNGLTDTRHGISMANAIGSTARQLKGLTEARNGISMTNFTESTGGI